jgi:hypothetical protein
MEARTLMAAGVTLQGVAFIDPTGAGTLTPTAAPVPNATVNLYTYDGLALLGQATTAADGSFLFDDSHNVFSGDLQPDAYDLVIVPPSGYAPSSVEVDPSLGGQGQNPDSALVGVDQDTPTVVNFGVMPGATVTGNVYFDRDGNGAYNTGDTPIANEYVTLTGKTSQGVPIQYYVPTGADGTYQANVVAGTYTVQDLMTTGMIAAKQTVGQVGGVTRGVTSGFNKVSSLTLTAGDVASGYNFGETDSALSGKVVRDLTGNSYDPNDTAMSGVTVKLYRDPNHTGVISTANGNTTPIATQTTATDGSYRFLSTGTGWFIVQEAVPSGYVRTYPLTTTNQIVEVCNCGNEHTGVLFANYLKPVTSNLTNVSYTIVHPDGTSRTVTDLRGQVRQADQVTANFTVKPSTSVEVSLVSYAAPTSNFDANNANQQFIYQVQHQTFGPGAHSLTVTAPNAYFQVDFVYGTPIQTFGPANGNIFYSAQGRLISADNGGTQIAGVSSLAGAVYVDANGNGVMDPGESGIAGVRLELMGYDYAGNFVDVIATTDSTGHYAFTNLVASDVNGYFIQVIPNQATLAPYIGEPADVGSLGGMDLGSGWISAILLNFNQNGTGYNFGERPRA